MNLLMNLRNESDIFPLIEVSTRKGRKNCIIYKILRVLLSKISVYTICELLMNLRNESDIFSVDPRYQPEKDGKLHHCALHICCKSVPVFFFCG